MTHKKAKVLGSAFIAMLLFYALFVVQVAAASPTILNFQPDRTTVGPSENVNFSVRTDASADFVFAMMDGVRTQGFLLFTDADGNREWSLTVAPTRTTNVVIFANTTNTEAGAAQLNIPVTVDFAAAIVPPLPANPTNPVVPHGAVPAITAIGPISIQAILETTPMAANMVQLTVVTGTATNYVWVRFDGNRTAHGHRVASDLTSQTWVINYQPHFFGPHSVTVYSNRSNTWVGAYTRAFNVVLHQPFIPLAHPVIQNVTVAPQPVTPGANVTIRVRTSADVGAVWLRDVDGIERVARSIPPTTATQRNWEIVFRPTRAGSVVIFANSTHTPWGAAQRAEHIAMRGGRATVTHATASRFTCWTLGTAADTVIRVTTNHFANSVWAVLPNRQVIPLVHVSGAGTSNRVWEVSTWVTGLPIVVHATENIGVVGGISDSSRIINSWTGLPTVVPLPPVIHHPTPWTVPTWQHTLWHQPVVCQQTLLWQQPILNVPPVCTLGFPTHVVVGGLGPCSICVYHGSGRWFNRVTNTFSWSPCTVWHGLPSTGVSVAGAGWIYIQNGWHFHPATNQSAWRGTGHGPPEWVNVHLHGRWYHMSRLGVMHPVAGGLPRATRVVP